MISLDGVKYVRVMKVEDKGKYVKATLSTSEKKQDGSREFSNWFASFVGSCVEQAKSLKEGDTIGIVKGKLSNVYNKEKKQAYLNMTVFEFLGGTEPSDDFSFSASYFEDFQSIEDDSSIPF